MTLVGQMSQVVVTSTMVQVIQNRITPTQNLDNMAIYDYKCENDHLYTEIRSIKENQKKTHCEYCNGELKQVYSAPLMQLKGSGFYKNSR
jgi:putative FmdB family regulatory protein